MTEQAQVLIIEDEAGMRDLLQKVLGRQGYTVRVVAEGKDALKLLEEETFDLVLTDVVMPGVNGMDILRFVKRERPETTVIIMTAFGTIDSAVQAMKEGAYHYISKPFKMEEILVVLEKALEEKRLREEVALLRQEVTGRYRFDNLIGKSKAMQEVFDLIRRVAPSKSTVLIYGKSGTGKELVAKAIHYNSPRRDRPFIAINCAAIPRELLESELFGHERGAFTGAVITKKGKFELAHGGTIFLDEIGDMDLSLQSKILRVLQEGEFERVGGEKTITSDVRVIAATNQDLKVAVANRTFREDLYYRLSVIPIELPELKDREEDIPLLAFHFLRKFSQELGAETKEISKEAMNIFLNYPWPGNVRELENVIERAVLLGDHRSILPKDLPPHLRAPEPQPLDKALKEEATLEDLEREYIGRVLEKTKGNQTRAARILGIDRRTLYRKVKKFALSRG